MAHLIAALAKDVNVVSIDLRSNRLTSVSGKGLAAALETNTHLTTLQVDDVRFNISDMSAIMEQLKINSSDAEGKRARLAQSKAQGTQGAADASATRTSAGVCIVA
jgi:hypothetical protein